VRVILSGIHWDNKRQKEKQSIHKCANKKERQSNVQLFHSKVHSQAIY